MSSTAPPLPATQPALHRKPHALSVTRRAETLTAWALVLPAFLGFGIF